MAGFIPIPIQQVSNIQHLDFNFSYSVPPAKPDERPQERTGVIEIYAGTVDIDYDKVDWSGRYQDYIHTFVPLPALLVRDYPQPIKTTSIVSLGSALSAAPSVPFSWAAGVTDPITKIQSVSYPAIQGAKNLLVLEALVHAFHSMVYQLNYQVTVQSFGPLDPAGLLPTPPFRPGSAIY
jgi:hypothetical protein